MEGTIYSIIPPVLALVMVMLTHKVLISLGAGAIVGAFILHNFSISKSLQQIFESVRAIFVSFNVEKNHWELNTWNVYIILFLLLLGIITAFINMTGGSRAFGEWALRHVKTRVGAHFVTFALGIIIFIDDYFNSLAVGQISRPLTDRHKISRAKLAYLIDSTSAPVCVISPVSSWGAYIIGLIATILVSHNVTEYSAFSAFIQMIPMNLYVFVTIAIVIAVSIFNLNIGLMKKHEDRAINENELYDFSKGEAPGELKDSVPVSTKGKISDLIIPILALVIGTVVAITITGLQATEGKATLLTVFENTDVSASLLYGGIFGLIVTLLTVFKQKLSFRTVRIGFTEGIRSMLPAITILIFAWTIIDIISSLETGTYLAGIVKELNINIAFLPVVLFVLGGIMAFATGTSWGTFGIMLPIAGDIAASTDISLLLPSLAAVLAGSVFGDHCSPISDTTILSSTGAGSHHIDHVLTQLPYAVIAAVTTIIGYVVLGLTGSILISMIVSSLLVVVIIFILLKTHSEKRIIKSTP